jgi:TfoX/Sxy family transcriptional regulator of competence genes
MRGQAMRRTGGGEQLVDCLRAALPPKGVSERRMFGGTCFMLNGNMVAGTFKDGVLLRVGKERRDEAMARGGARPFEMRGRPLQGYVVVDAAGLEDGSMRDWLKLALDFVRTLPPKQASSTPTKSRATRVKSVKRAAARATRSRP